MKVIPKFAALKCVAAKARLQLVSNWDGVNCEDDIPRRAENSRFRHIPGTKSVLRQVYRRCDMYPIHLLRFIGRTSLVTHSALRNLPNILGKFTWSVEESDRRSPAQEDGSGKERPTINHPALGLVFCVHCNSKTEDIPCSGKTPFV